MNVYSNPASTCQLEGSPNNSINCPKSDDARKDKHPRRLSCFQHYRFVSSLEFRNQFVSHYFGIDNHQCYTVFLLALLLSHVTARYTKDIGNNERKFIPVKVEILTRTLKHLPQSHNPSCQENLLAPG